MASHTILRSEIAALRSAIRRREQSVGRVVEGVVSSGCRGLDELFPAGGVRRGSLVEWVGTGDETGGGGVVTLSLTLAKHVVPEQRTMLLVDRRRELFPLSLRAMGIDLDRLVVVRPRTEREAFGVCEEALRCPGIGLVWMEIERLDGVGFRRLQLAAAEGGTVGFFVRPEAALRQPSWAEMRLQVRSVPSRDSSLWVRVDVAYRQGWARRSGSELRIDHVQGTIHEVSSCSATPPVPVAS